MWNVLTNRRHGQGRIGLLYRRRQLVTWAFIFHRHLMAWTLPKFRRRGFCKTCIQRLLIIDTRRHFIVGSHILAVTLKGMGHEVRTEHFIANLNDMFLKCCDRMVWYHGTSSENWGKIQAEGVLWGRKSETESLSRVTWLATKAENAGKHGDIVLEVKYNPFNRHHKGALNNFNPEGWQMRVYEPIPVNQVTVFSVNTEKSTITA